MRVGRHPVRDGVIAIAIGSVLGLLVLVGVRATQPLTAPAPLATPAPRQAPTTSQDACDLRDQGGGGAAEPDPRPGPDFPRQEHQLDTGRPVTVHGSGNAEVAYQRLGEFATVVDFDCPECLGSLTLFNTGAQMPIVSGDTGGEPVQLQWLIDTVHEQTDGPHNSLLVGATGEWTLTLRSWYDLPIQTAEVNGRGAQVLRVAAPSVRVSFAPLNSRDKLNVYAYRFSDRGFAANLCVGRFESSTLDLHGGEVLLVWARGEWTLAPV